MSCTTSATPKAMKPLMADANTPSGTWTDVDRATADWLEEDLRVALGLAEGEHVEHFVIGVQVGSREADGKPRRIMAVACCRNTTAPTNLMNMVVQILSEKN